MVSDQPRKLRAELIHLEQRRADLEARLPAHSVPPSMMQELEEMEERLVELREAVAVQTSGM